MEMRKSAENYDKHRFEVYRNNLLGLDEMIKKLWIVADSPRTDSREKIKVIVLIGQYYRERLQLIRDEPGLIEQMKRIDRMKRFDTSKSMTLQKQLSKEQMRKLSE
jgi:hypothetical protein